MFRIAEEKKDLLITAVHIDRKFLTAESQPVAMYLTEPPWMLGRTLVLHLIGQTEIKMEKRFKSYNMLTSKII